MDKLSNLALLQQMLESAEKNIQAAKSLLREILGGRPAVVSMMEKAAITLSAPSGGRIIEGVFDGQNMVGPDGKKYPVPANYASKSKLVEGDVMKLTIADDGSFIYKQIGPVERARKIGILTQQENGEYRVLAEGKSYKILLASLTYFKAEPGDEVTLVVSNDSESEWGAIENLVKKDSGNIGSANSASESSPGPRQDLDSDLELPE